MHGVERQILKVIEQGELHKMESRSSRLMVKRNDFTSVSTKKM